MESLKERLERPAMAMRGRLLLIALALALAGGASAAGRFSADASAAFDHGHAAGLAEGHAAGLAEGEAEGLRTGRALQAPVSAQDAFNAGYAAGTNDAFGGFDGGWEAGLPYVVVVARADGDVTYRMLSRTPMHDGVVYRLCAQSHAVCHS